MSEQAQEQATKKERKSSYYVVQAPQELKTKKQVEEFLEKNGGLKAGQILLRGAQVVAAQKSVYKLG